jgi:hypothetical protein
MLRTQGAVECRWPALNFMIPGACWRRLGVPLGIATHSQLGTCMENVQI